MLISKRRDLVGIDIGSSSVKLVQLKEQKGVYSLVNIGIVPLPSEAIVDNTLMDTSSIVEGIKSLVKGLAIRATDAACSISGNSVIIRKIGFPSMTSEELEDQIQWEAEQYIPFDINDVNIDFQIISPDEHDPSRMNVLLVASKKDIINDYVAVFGEAGLRLTVVDVDSFAVQNCFDTNYEVDPEEIIALVNIGASIMNLNIVKGGTSLFTRDVQMGGNLYTEEIQKRLSISGEEAEKIKVSGQHRERLADIVGRINDTISMEIHRSLDFYNSSAGDGRISRIFLSGGGAKIPSLTEALNQRLGLPVEIIDPFQKIKVADKDFDREYLNDVGPLVTVAVGLATRRLGDK
jgi:type IV pilus assembly protein PilM